MTGLLYPQELFTLSHWRKNKICFNIHTQQDNFMGKLDISQSGHNFIQIV